MRSTTPRATIASAVMAFAAIHFPVFAQASQPASCPRPPIECPDPISTSTFVRINLQMEGETCRFNPRTIDELRLTVGGFDDDVVWDFCNACPMDIAVRIDDPGGDGPFDRFQVFTPTPDASNQVTVNVPCHDYRNAVGTNAVSGGGWKYFLRAQPAGSATFPDEIDPRLEIDDPGARKWIERIGLVLLGALVAYLMLRRRAVRP